MRSGATNTFSAMVVAGQLASQWAVLEGNLWGAKSSWGVKMANLITVDSIKGGSCVVGGTQKKDRKRKKEEEVEQRKEREKRKEKEKKKKTQSEAWVIGIEACINRLPISLPLDRLTIWEIKDWNLNHLDHFSKVHNFYGRSHLWGYSCWGLVPFLDFYLLRS